MSDCTTMKEEECLRYIQVIGSWLRRCGDEPSLWRSEDLDTLGRLLVSFSNQEYEDSDEYSEFWFRATGNRRLPR